MSHVSYIDSQCDAIVTFWHRVIQNHVVVLTQQVVDLEQSPQAYALSYFEITAQRHVARIPWLGIVVSDIFLLVIALSDIDVTIVEIPFTPCQINHRRAGMVGNIRNLVAIVIV